MAEHLHGYPRCETPAGASCNASEPHGDECKNHGVFRSCEASVVDGIPTGQYRCAHEDAPSQAAPVKKAAAKPKAKARKATRVRAKKKKAAPRKAKAKKGAKKTSKKRTAKKKGARKKK
ncbi:MAG TPA: hypothetical protein VEG84_02420 [Thermoanaerobaculia bacterium]|jgi:hypothetical protein|nr:hypothetical protein [Thermoanaerobaculia bacterium]